MYIETMDHAFPALKYPNKNLVQLYFQPLVIIHPLWWHVESHHHHHHHHILLFFHFVMVSLPSYKTYHISQSLRRHNLESMIFRTSRERWDMMLVVWTAIFPLLNLGPYFCGKLSLTILRKLHHRLVVSKKSPTRPTFHGPLSLSI